MATFKTDPPSQPTTPQASHDTQSPPSLLRFMMQGWKPAKPVNEKPIEGLDRFKERRAALSKLFPGDYLFIPTGHAKVRSNDDLYRFRGGSDFVYFTGSTEPDCALLMVPQVMGGHRAVLFVEEHPGKKDSTFFTDRVKGELWVGPRLGTAGSLKRFGVDECLGLHQLQGHMAGLPQGKVRVLRGFSPEQEGWALNLGIQSGAQGDKDQEFATALSEMRLIKDAFEVKQLERAVNASKLAFEDVVARMKKAKSERELEGVFYTRARMEGNDVGYGTIVASGHHACTLHWNKNDGALKKSDLLLLDGGVEMDTLYTADITRTFPLGGKFSREQKQIYELVLKAQKAGIAEVKPGADYLAPNRAAMKVLAHGLHELGILKEKPEDALRDENQFYRRYSLHNVSHMLGLDVHDCARARQENYKYGKLRAGMVLTVEPGLYFQLDDLTVPAKYRGIGIRIEDDVLVTPKGSRNLSEALPREVAELEKWIQRIWKRKA